MQELKEKWLQLSERFSALAEREKWLLFGGGWISIVMLFLTFILDPVEVKRNNLKNSLESEEKSVVTTQKEVSGLESKLTSNPDEEIDNKLKQLMVENQELSKELSEVVNGLILPSQMATLLEQVLSSSGNLRLVSLQSLPAESITQTSDETGYFLHPVRITLTGRYFDIKDYLAKLEKMPMKYYWRSFDYQIEKYPTAKLVLEVYTLGARQEFISG